MSKLRLHKEDGQDDAIPFPSRLTSGPARWRDDTDNRRESSDPVIAAAEETLDRMARQLANLRELMGDCDGPAGPRAA